MGRDNKERSKRRCCSMQCGPASAKSRRIGRDVFDDGDRVSRGELPRRGDGRRVGGVRRNGIPRIDLAVSRAAIDTDRIEPHPDQSGRGPAVPREALEHL